MISNLFRGLVTIAALVLFGVACLQVGQAASLGNFAEANFNLTFAVVLYFVAKSAFDDIEKSLAKQRSKRASMEINRILDDIIKEINKKQNDD